MKVQNREQPCKLKAGAIKDEAKTPRGNQREQSALSLRDLIGKLDQAVR